MVEHIGKITRKVLEMTLNQLDQREITLGIIKGMVELKIPEFEDTHIVTDASELDGEIRFGVKKKSTIIKL